MVSGSGVPFQTARQWQFDLGGQTVDIDKVAFYASRANFTLNDEDEHGPRRFAVTAVEGGALQGEMWIMSDAEVAEMNAASGRGMVEF
jgi:hypothetical protein